MTEPPARIDPALERRLAALVHASGIVLTILAPLAAAVVWGRAASPWLRRHLRDALVHWAIALALVVGAFGLDAMNPVYDFGAIRLAAARVNFLSLPGNTAALAWGASLPFAVVSARRAMQGDSPLYPFTMWWNASAPAQDETAETAPGREG